MSTQTAEKPVGHITLLGWTLSYPHLFEAHLPPGGTNKRFGAELRLPKDHPNAKAELAKVQGEIDRIKKDKEKGKVKIFASDICLKDGDTWERAKDDQKGHWLLSVNRSEGQGRPRLVGKKKEDIQEAAIKATFYPGAVVNAKVGIFYTAKGGGHKIPGSLEVLQFSAHGERLGGGGGEASIDDLPEIEDDEELPDPEEDFG